MTQHTNNGPEAGFEALERRVHTLESGRTTRWLLAVFLPGVVLPVVTYLIIHFLFDRPAESGQFEARYDLKIDETSSPAPYRYTLTIKNTGWRRQSDYLGKARVEFPSSIEDVDPVSTPPGTTYGRMKSHDARFCIRSQECDIGWGGLDPGGEFIIVFAIESPPDESISLPSVRYGGCTIKRWICSGLPDILLALCAPSVQPQPGMGGTRFFRQLDSRC